MPPSSAMMRDKVLALFAAARSNRAPIVEESRAGWMSDYNRIRHDFDNAAAAFAFDCPAMTPS